MADAQQVLHMKEDAAHDSGTFGRSSVTLPSPCAMKKCRHFQSSLTGCRPVMSHPVASARRARIAALCAIATTGSPAGAIVPRPAGEAAHGDARRLAARRVEVEAEPFGRGKGLAAFGAELAHALALPDTEAHLAQPRFDP
jgi:hypothetical protein